MRKPILFASCFLSLTLTGCAPNEIYRSDYSVCSGQTLDACAEHAIAHYQNPDSSDFHLGYIEYDDQGQLRDRDQMHKVLDHFYKRAADNQVLITVFIHGWHHSAAPDDTNVASYKNLLANIARNENLMSASMNTAPREVLGLYIGWRGDSITVPYLNVSTFWNRKRVAQEVGLQGVTETLLRLEQIINVKAAQGDSNSKLISIGHSFGGAVLFTAMQQLLTDRYFDSHRGKSYQAGVRGFGDLVLLINPAFEALRFSTLRDLAQDFCRQYTSEQLPKLVIMTSEADKATGVAFPAGRLLSSLAQKHNTLSRHDCTQEGAMPILVSESLADRKSVGHFKTYQTHWLAPREKTEETDISVAYFVDLKQQWDELSYDGTLNFDQVTLKHLNRTVPHNPYLNIYVDKAIIPDHNNIWGEQVIRFIEDLVMITSNSEALSK